MDRGPSARLLVPEGRPGAVVTGGSADSVLTSGEVLRRTGGPTEVVVTMAPEVHRVRVDGWPAGTGVVLVGIPVRKPRAEGTIAFLRALLAAGHELVAVVDEHEAEDWRRALDAVGTSFDRLAVRPTSQETSPHRSAGALLLHALGDDVDARGRALLEAANLCDARGFDESGLAYCANAVLKAAPRDGARKAAFVHWLAASPTVERLHESTGGMAALRAVLDRSGGEDARVAAWAGEYAALEREHERVLREAVDAGDGVFTFALERPVDMTVLTLRLEAAGARAILYEADFHHPRSGTTRREIGIGSGDRRLRKLADHLKRAGVPITGGYGSRPRVALADAERALAVVRGLL